MTDGTQTLRSCFYDDEGKPCLVPSFCVFVDFLGFRHEIKTAAESGRENEAFQKFITEIEPVIVQATSASDLEIKYEKKRHWDAKVFTDNIVFGYPFWSKDKEGEFGQALLTMSYFQLSTATKGYFVRGGWAMGNLFMNNNTVFGNSLLDAYEIESKKACYPRIVLSCEVREVAKSHMPFYSPNSIPPHCRHLAIDSDKQIFTNYLMWLAEDEIIEWKWLQKHKLQIDQNLRRHANDERVYPKYEWLASYHNFFCDYYQEESGYSEEYRIDGAFPDFGIRFLERKDLEQQ